MPEDEKCKPRLSVSCKDDLAFEYKRICFEQGMAQNKPLLDFVNEFVAGKGKVRVIKDYTKGGKKRDGQQERGQSR
jgi:hypothetical protein